MKKQEYIEKYGEEAYLKYREAKREYKRLWVKANPEKVKNSARKYYLKNAEAISVKNKKWKEENKEYVIARDKKYREENQRTDYFNEYRKKNKEKLTYKNSIYRSQTKNGRSVSLNNRYKGEDKNRGFDVSNNISSSWIVENIFSGQKCVYCGDQDWKHLGCDRMDNNKPHTADNIVCACFICNVDRGDRYTVEEFKQYRSLHPRACDIPKAPAIQLSETGAIKKRAIPVG